MKSLNWPCRYDGKSATTDFFLGNPDVNAAPASLLIDPSTQLPLVQAAVTSITVTLTDTSGTAISGSSSYTATFVRAGCWLVVLPADLALTLGTAYWINATILLASGAKVYTTAVVIAAMYQGEG